MRTVLVNTILLLFGIWSAGIGAAYAQGVRVELAFEQDYYLPYESLPLKVKITNFSGRTLKLGKEANWLEFSIQGQRNTIVTQLTRVPVTGEFDLESAQVATKTVDIAPFFDLSRPGQYTITATVRIPELRQSIESGPESFYLAAGTKLWEQDFGVPRIAGTNENAPQIRKYSLIQATHQSRLKLYLRLSSPDETRVFRVFAIGPMVAFSRPEPQLDKYSNLHLLYQTGARTFLYSVVSPDGLLIGRETYEYTDTRPELAAAQAGRIRVKGGTRKPAPTDIPPGGSADKLSNATQPQR